MLLEIAGLRVAVSGACPYVKRICADYAVPAGEPSLSVTLTQKDGQDQSVALLEAVSREMLSHDGFLMHASALSYDGSAILFTAPSGTGKSTHAAMWRKSFGEHVVMINDDKPILRFGEGDELFAYGTPWCGKHRLGSNIKAPVRAIVFLRRGKENSIKRVSPPDIIGAVLDQIHRPEDPALMDKTLSLLGATLEKTPLFVLSCTPDAKAAETAFSAIKGVLK